MNKYTQVFALIKIQVMKLQIGTMPQLLTLWHPAAFGDFRKKKKRRNARGFVRELLRSCIGNGPGRSVNRRGKSSDLHSKKNFLLGDADFL